jgi:hypothetical protein
MALGFEGEEGGPPSFTVEQDERVFSGYEAQRRDERCEIRDNL